MSDTGFNGFPAAGIQFLADVVENNNRDWFEANKKNYTDNLRDPAVAFIGALGAKLKTISAGIVADTRTNGSGSLMRIYRDVRFSKDKSPYKTNLGIVFWEGAGKKTEVPSFYFHMDAESAMLYAGLYQFPKPFLTAYREAVADDKFGAELSSILDDIKNAGDYEVSGEHYKKVPRGYTADHPRADLLRHNGLGARSPLLDRATVTSPELVAVCFQYAQVMSPLQQWLVRVNDRLPQPE